MIRAIILVDVVLIVVNWNFCYLSHSNHKLLFQTLRSCCHHLAGIHLFANCPEKSWDCHRKGHERPSKERTRN